ncbi:P-loop containing nucleoside triphosphate hydrolase protein, partial [Boletus edulis]
KEKLEPCLIRSDVFPKSIVEAERLLLDCKVILCTLSMFSHPKIDVFMRIVPVEMIILDEASQIECGNYLPIFYHFHSTLSKLVFIGDDKQLPPYGREDIPELRSVFEFSHLRSRASFLDTQYRMPLVIGSFISRHVYRGKLRTSHSPTTSKACRFIDVNNGRETKGGHSWINKEEARVVVKVARLYESSGMSFRIITPYDAQRAHIESLLEVEGLSVNDKVFNVDSFQGSNQRRTNVMLTRCKQSMVICSSRGFLFGEASKTLVGKLATSVTRRNWIDGHEFLCGRVELCIDPLTLSVM